MAEVSFELNLPQSKSVPQPLLLTSSPLYELLLPYLEGSSSEVLLWWQCLGGDCRGSFVCSFFLCSRGQGPAFASITLFCPFNVLQVIARVCKLTVSQSSESEPWLEEAWSNFCLHTVSDL